MSAPVNGDFSCSELLVIQAKAEAIFNDDVRNADVTPFAESAIALLQNQTATFEALKDADKDREIKVTWVQACDMEVVDCTDQCNISGEEAGSLCQNYALGVCKETSFSVTDNVFRTSTLSADEVVARKMATALKALDEFWAQQVVAKLVLFAGVNQLTAPYTVAGTETQVPAAAMNASFNGYLALAMAYNKMKSMYMLSGTSLYLTNWNAEQESANAQNGAANQRKMQTFKKYFDLFNVDTVTAANTVFLINPSAAAMVTKTRFSTVPIEVKGKNINQKRYTVASNVLPNVFYDVYYELGCANDDITYSWKIVTRGDIFQNPLGCTSTRTGILQFTCV